MCKIFVSSGINDNNREGHTKLYEAMAKVMSKEYSHRDGLGYAAVDEEGNLFGERWLENSDAFDNSKRTPITERDRLFMKNFKGFLDKKEKYNSFGTLNLNKITAMTLHTRLATSGKAFKNTHPFVENDTSVIHNGVISNWEKLRVEQSTCDSEAILTQYVDNEVGIDPERFQIAAKNLQGYYACGIFSRDVENKRVLDVVKSSTAALIAAYIPELDSMVFTSLVEHIKEGCKMAGLTIDGLYEVNPSSMMRINPITGNVEHCFQFTEKTYTYSYSGGHWNGQKWVTDEEYDEDDAVEDKKADAKKTRLEIAYENKNNSNKGKIRRVEKTADGKTVIKYYEPNDPRLLADIKKSTDCYTHDDVKQVQEFLNNRKNT